jgi:hypothetical protein
MFANAGITWGRVRRLVGIESHDCRNAIFCFIIQRDNGSVQRAAASDSTISKSATTAAPLQPMVIPDFRRAETCRLLNACEKEIQLGRA